MNKAQFNKSEYKKDIKEVVLTCESMRRDKDNPVDVSLQEFIHSRWGISMEAFYEDLGITPSVDTIDLIFNMPDADVRWLIPEIIRDALRLGLRKNPIWADMIAAEQTIANPSVTIPHINMSEAAPHRVGELETIKTGTISFGSKNLKVSKLGRGIVIPYEVRQYVTLNVIGIFLQDFGIKLNHGLDALMIDVLLNGEQANGSESAPVVGIANTTEGFKYRDLLKIWVRMSRLGRTATAIIGGEEAAIDTLDLPEFKDKKQGTTDANVNLKTPVPNSVDYFIHGAMPDDQQLLIDKTSAIIKYNAQPLLVESDKIISNQSIETYASLTTGFGILYRDARIVIDHSLAFADNGFPPYMEVDALEQVNFE